MRSISASVALLGTLSGCFLFPPGTTADETGAADEPDEYEDVGDFRLRWGSDGGYEDYADWTKEWLEGSNDYLNEQYRLPIDIDIRHEKCGMENATWDGERITMCYEMEARVVELFDGALETEEDILSASSAAWVFILFHEVGHGLIDVYGLPVPGREEDAVDSFSAVALIDGGAPDAVVYAALFWLLIEQDSGGEPNFADEHSMNMQRFYSLLCWVYGSDPRGYEYLVEIFPDLESRIAGGRCEAEYEQQSDSWHELLEPWYQ